MNHTTEAEFGNDDGHIFTREATFEIDECDATLVSALFNGRQFYRETLAAFWGEANIRAVEVGIHEQWCDDNPGPAYGAEHASHFQDIERRA